jgi:hypothetical protein
MPRTCDNMSAQLQLSTTDVLFRCHKAEWAARNSV